MKKTFILLLTLLSLCSFLSAQVPSGFSLQTRLSQLGDATDPAPTYSSFQTSHDFESRFSWGAGAAYQHSLFWNFGIKLGVQYDQDQFTRVESYQYISSQGVNRGGEIQRDFSNSGLSIPLQLCWQYKRIGFAGGVAPHFFLKTKLEEEHIFFVQGKESSRSQVAYESGEYVEFGWGDWYRTDLEETFDVQLMLSMYVYLTSNLSLDVQYKGFISDALLVREISNYDVIGTFTDTYDPFARSHWSVGVNWLFGVGQEKGSSNIHPH